MKLAMVAFLGVLLGWGLHAYGQPVDATHQAFEAGYRSGVGNRAPVEALECGTAGCRLAISAGVAVAITSAGVFGWGLAQWQRRGL